MSNSTKASKILDDEDITNRVENTLKLKALHNSKIADAKDSFKHLEKEKAFNKRYGKKIRTAWTYEMDGVELREYTMRAESENGEHYSLTEYLKEGLTEYCILCYRKNGKNMQNRFERYVDAEVSLADLISQED